MHKNILATHEESQPIAIPPFEWPGELALGVALPSRNALGKKVFIQHGENAVIATVMDIGPWCIDDDDYVFGTARPRAEIFKGEFCPMTKGSLEKTLPIRSNGAGIDLFPGTARALNIPMDLNTNVDWEFVDPPEPHNAVQS